MFFFIFLSSFLLKNGTILDIPLRVSVYKEVDRLEWELDEDGFPLAHISKQLQGTDFQPLSKGTPVLILRDGTVQTYDREEGLVPIFVNEAAYYSASSGMGVGLAKQFTVNTTTHKL